ncbi:MAG: pilus assembly protein MshL [Sulfurimonas sp.]|nr:MAG: pilus assembly protein MshL [Sulfurimonas sp.]
MKFLNTSILSILLTLLFSTNAVAECSYELFSISSTKDTKIVDFVEHLSNECDLTIIITDPYASKFLDTKLNRTNLNNLTLTEVLDIILKENNLSYTLENNLLKISYLTTKMFEIDYILSQRRSTGSTDITLSSQSQTGVGSSSNSGANQTNSNSGGGGGASGGGANAMSGIKIETVDEVEFWEKLDLELQRVLNRPQDVYIAEPPIINKNAGIITVTATIKQMNRLEKYLKKLQDKVQLQVLIDVKLLSVTLNKSKSTGVDWEQLYALQNFKVESSLAMGDTLNKNYITLSGGGSLNQVIKFLQTQGDVSSISNPKVLTLNNQSALITAGTEYFYKITNSTNQGTSGGSTISVNQLVQSVFAGVLLDITPEISDDLTITLKINPSLSSTVSDISSEDNSNRSMPPDLVRRQLATVVTVKDGNRIILGGLINTKNSVVTSKVPILGDIPIINNLFKYENKIKVLEELVIIIEPHIINKDKNNLSLADLGYDGISITKEKSLSKQSDLLLKTFKTKDAK